jgi:hypothetical protein
MASASATATVAHRTVHGALGEMVAASDDARVCVGKELVPEHDDLVVGRISLPCVSFV